MKIGMTLNDWAWRAVAALAALLFPVFVVLVWACDGRKRLWTTVREAAKDVGLTLVYGNYDNARL